MVGSIRASIAAPDWTGGDIGSAAPLPVCAGLSGAAGAASCTSARVHPGKYIISGKISSIRKLGSMHTTFLRSRVVKIKSAT